LKAQLLLIVYRGKILWDAAKKEQLGELEILGGIRNSGTAAIEDVLATVLEPDGTFSVISLSASSNGHLPTALRDVPGVPEFEHDQDDNSDREKVKRAAAQ